MALRVFEIFINFWCIVILKFLAEFLKTFDINDIDSMYTICAPQRIGNGPPDHQPIEKLDQSKKRLIQKF